MEGPLVLAPLLALASSREEWNMDECDWKARGECGNDEGVAPGDDDEDPAAVPRPPEPGTAIPEVAAFPGEEERARWEGLPRWRGA